MRVAFTGASGAGKTTLVKFVSNTYRLPWLNGSSGDLKTVSDTRQLTRKGLVQGRGHRDVIQSGHANPQASWENQTAILVRRAELLYQENEFVTDRSPIDNVVYMLMQSSMYRSEQDVEKFIFEAGKHLPRITHLIQVRTFGQTEDNGSRVPNIFFQEMVEAVFDHVINSFYQNDNVYPKPDLLILDPSSIEDRYAKIRDFLLKVNYLE